MLPDSFVARRPNRRSLVAESIDVIRRPCHACTTVTAEHRRLVAQVAFVRKTRVLIILWARHPKVMHAINMLECPRCL